MYISIFCQFAYLYKKRALDCSKWQRKNDADKSLERIIWKRAELRSQRLRNYKNEYSCLTSIFSGEQTRPSVRPHARLAKQNFCESTWKILTLIVYLSAIFMAGVNSGARKMSCAKNESYCSRRRDEFNFCLILPQPLDCADLRFCDGREENALVVVGPSCATGERFSLLILAHHCTATSRTAHKLLALQARLLFLKLFRRPFLWEWRATLQRAECKTIEWFRGHNLI